MEFVRTIVDSSKLENLVEIPSAFRNRKVELLILPLPEKKKKGTFNPDDFEGILDLDSEVLEKELKSMRNEWE